MRPLESLTERYPRTTLYVLFVMTAILMLRVLP